MKKITFKVSEQKDYSITSLIKEINKVSCRIYLDLENSFITVENVNDAMIDAVIDLIQKYYNILKVDIDNITEALAQNQELSREPQENNVNKKETTVLGPQSEDDLIIKKVAVNNQYVEEMVNRLLKTIYWAMFNKKVSEKEIGEVIYTCISEISMEYTNKERIVFSVGDIVDCNYGHHLAGEISGGHVHGIVCDVDQKADMAYVVPITKAPESEVISSSYLKFAAPDDATYKNNSYKGGTALLDKGRYIRIARFREVVGKASQKFLNKLLSQLSTTFDFTKCNFDIIEKQIVEKNKGQNFKSEEGLMAKDTQISKKSEESPIKYGVISYEEKDTLISKDEEKASVEKTGKEEAALIEAIGSSLDKLENTEPIMEQINEQIIDFLREIGMPVTNYVETAFNVACSLNKISYGTIIAKIYEIKAINKDFKSVKKEIEADLKESFKSWSENYPELVKKCPRISIISLLKVFVKRFKYIG